MARGTITAHALTSIEARGILFVPPGIEVCLTLYKVYALRKHSVQYF